MKKTLLWVILGMILIVMGCSKVSVNDNNNIKATEDSPKTIDYAKLSRSEKNEMTFQFSRSSLAADTIDLKIINRTNKNVSFNKSNLLLVHSNDDEISADKNGDTVVESNSTKKVKKVFSNLETTEFQTVGLFIYKNIKNKLAYSEINSLIDSSSNLTKSSLQKAYKATSKVTKTKKSTTNETKDTTTDTQQTDQNNSTEDTDTESDQDTSQTTQNDQTSASTNSVNSSQEAIALVENQSGESSDNNYSVVINATSGDSDTVKDSNGESVYWIRSTKKDDSATSSTQSSDDWTIYPDGYVVHGSPSM